VGEREGEGAEILPSDPEKEECKLEVTLMGFSSKVTLALGLTFLKVRWI